MSTPTREAHDIFDEMAKAVVATSGRTEELAPGTDLDRFSVAALLRFPVPAPDQNGSAEPLVGR